MLAALPVHGFGCRKHCCVGQHNISREVPGLSMLTRRRMIPADRRSARKWKCCAASTNNGGWDKAHPQRDSVDEEWQVRNTFVQHPRMRNNQCCPVLFDASLDVSSAGSEFSLTTEPLTSVHLSRSACVRSIGSSTQIWTSYGQRRHASLQSYAQPSKA